MKWKPKQTLIGMFILAAVGYLTSTAISADGGQTEKMDMKLRLKPGDTYKMRISVEQTISNRQQSISKSAISMPPTPVPQQIQPINAPPNSLVLELLFEVKDIDSSGYTTILTKIKSISPKKYQFNGRIEAELTSGLSRGPYPFIPNTTEVLTALESQPSAAPKIEQDWGFTINITPDGQIKKLIGVDFMLDYLRKQITIPSTASDSLKSRYLRVVADRFQVHKAKIGDEVLRHALDQMFVVLPKTPVEIGDSWNNKFIIPPFFPIFVDDDPRTMILRNTWTLISRKDQVALLEVKSKIEPDPDTKSFVAISRAEGSGPPGVSMNFATYKTCKYEFNGTQEGTMELDESSGWPLKGKIVQKFDAKGQVIGTRNTQGETYGAVRNESQSYTCERILIFEKL
jgi:hypothetical protein